MRHHRLRPRTWLVPLGVVLALASCSDNVGVGGYTVTYRANVTGIATIDSVLYDNGKGRCTASCNADSTLVKVTAPSAAWVVTLSVASGGLVEVHLYGSGTAAGSANLVRLWMTATGDIAGDSVTATTLPAIKFTADLASRHL